MTVWHKICISVGMASSEDRSALPSRTRALNPKRHKRMVAEVTSIPGALTPLPLPELRRSVPETLLRLAFEISVSGLAFLDDEGRICGGNAALAKMLGVDPDDLVGRLLIEFVATEDVAKAESTLEQLREPGHRPVQLAIKFRRPDGKLAWTDCNFARSSGPDAGGFSVELHDVSAWRQSEDDLVWAQTQLVQQEKMASIGQLAAGVAHEINNPLGYVHSNLSTLSDYLRDLLRIVDGYEAIERDVPPENPAWAELRKSRRRVDLEYLRKDMVDLVEESKEGMRRMEKIVGDLRDFSRAESNDDWAFADLHRGLESTLNIVNNEIKYKAVIEKNYGDLPAIECRSSQLNQVFMNLLVNASQAIPKRGVIGVATGVQGDEVWVDISDDGIGIRPELMARIFDPFFTTKPVGTGTGLGLALSYTIVQRHGGRIEVDSKPGRGTRFRVWLPIRQRPSPTAAAIGSA